MHSFAYLEGVYWVCLLVGPFVASVIGPNPGNEATPKAPFINHPVAYVAAILPIALFPASVRALWG